MTINHVNKTICFSKVRTGTTSQFTWCYFGHIGVFEVILVVHCILVVLGVLSVFWLLCYFLGEFGHIRVFGVILVILGVRYYFVHYGVFRVILVILEFSGLYWLF